MNKFAMFIVIFGIAAIYKAIEAGSYKPLIAAAIIAIMLKPFLRQSD